MKELKRISAFFMAMLMMLTVFSAFSAVSAEGEAAGGTQPVWPAQGSIKLDKDAAAVAGKENLWEVTLGIQGKNFETTSDVVLVIDCSGSMEGTKLTNTRKAAKAFGQKLLADGSSTRIAIVTFIDTAAAYNNGHFTMRPSFLLLRRLLMRQHMQKAAPTSRQVFTLLSSF